MDEHAVLVGVLDLDDEGRLVQLTGVPETAHQHVRLLVRLHRAPLGYVRLAACPTETLGQRAVAAAEAELGLALRRHELCHKTASATDQATRERSQLSCPQYFQPTGPGISVVVCTRDRSHELWGCLNSMRQFSYQPLEILVIENAPKDDATRQVVDAIGRLDSRIRYACEEEPGLSRARNRALVDAKFDIVAFTDDDALTDPGWPTALAAGFAADPLTTCVTGLVAANNLESSSERYFDWRYAARQAFEPRHFIEDHSAATLYPYNAGIFGTGANFAVRRKAILELGGFDPLLGVGSKGRGGEDLDIFLRIILSGGRINYLPSALVWHRHRADANTLHEQIYAYGHGLGAYLAQHLGDRRLRRGLMAHGLRQLAMAFGRMSRAARESGLGVAAVRYWISEARGVVAGALYFWSTAR